MDGWGMSSQNVCTKLLSLSDNATKTQFLVPQHKNLHPLQGSTPSLTIPSSHTHKTSKNFAYGFVLGPLQFQPTGQNTHLTSKQLSTVPLPDNCVMIPIFQDGSLPFQHTHKHSSPLRQALHTQIANHHIQRARKSC